MIKYKTIKQIDGSESKVCYCTPDCKTPMPDKKKIAALKRRSNIALLCGKNKEMTMAHIVQKKRKEQFDIQCSQFRESALNTQFVKWCIDKEVPPYRTREMRVKKYGTIFDAFEVLQFKYDKEKDPKYISLKTELEENWDNEYGKHCGILIFVKDPEETQKQMIKRLVKETLSYIHPGPIIYTEIVDQYDKEKDETTQVEVEKRQEQLPENLFILADLSQQERKMFLDALMKKQKKIFLLCDRTVFICDERVKTLPSPVEGWNAAGVYDINGEPIRYKRFHDTLI